MKLLTSNGVVRLWKHILAKLKAVFIEYDNTESKLESLTVQGAIDEVNSKVVNIIFATEDPTEVPENTIVAVYEE